ncbi:MAG: hypothetical protein AB9873_10210 [Syntrophobacteraceae bacterium]
MKRVVWYVLFFAVVIVSWAVFAQQRKTLTAAGPAQTTASPQSHSAASAGR